MDNFTTLMIVTNLVCLFGGLVGGFVLANLQNRQALKSLMEDVAKLRDTNLVLVEQKAAAEVKSEELEEREETLKEQFKASANSILLETADSTKDRHSKALDEIIKPLKKQIKEFKEETESFRETDIKEKATLKAQIVDLRALSEALGKRTDGLSMVLRGDQRTQGVWGEIVLRTLLEKSGLVEGRHFFEQGRGFKLKDEEGNPLRPDYLIKMPSEGNDQGECVIVDSKVSLTAYDRYVNAESPEKKQEQLELHIMSVKNHINELSKKRYETVEGLLTVDYVFLFMGIESALITAMDDDPGLQDLAIEKNVILVSQSMLLPALRSVAFLWRRDSQIQNIKEIVKQADNMYEGFQNFVRTLAKVKKAITNADESIDLATKRLTTGRGSLTRRAEIIKGLSTARINNEDSGVIE